MIDVGAFYEAACQVPTRPEGATTFSGHTSSERAHPLQPAKGCARERVVIAACRQAHSSSPRISEVTHPFIRAHRWRVMRRRTGGSEGGAAPSVGRLSRAA